MKVSLNCVQQYLDFELPPADELVERIGSQLGAVEGVENVAEKYQGVVVAKVVSCLKHPDSDHLHVCLIDDGGKATGVERDASGYVQVVCGAPNVREGLLVAWLPPGSTVPESIGHEPFVLSTRELRGVKSNGMLASPRELALGDSHDGILDIRVEAQPGDDFASVYGLNDTIIDIENKMFTHRPDCFGQLGVAREIAGILGHKFTSPEWYGQTKTAQFDQAAETLPLQVQNELPNLVPRFMVVPLSNVAVGPSPAWLQTFLQRVGVRPISNVVDITNYLMLLTGQPMHAYDYDKLRGNREQVTLVVRNPKPGENVKLLNGKTLSPRSEAIVIATENELVGIGGVMGGADTEVDSTTTRIVLECATFDMYSIRRTSMAHGLFTDAVSRFNKGQSPLQNGAIVGEAVRLLRELSGAALAGPVIDNCQFDLSRRWVHPPVPLNAEFVNARLGLNLTAHDMQQLLENVEFTVTVDGDELTVTTPFWRTDIETREDVVEEIGRLYGFDKLPLELPVRSITPAAKDPLFELKSTVRAVLAKAGANEVLTYSFVHGNLLEKAGQDKAAAFQVGNALSPDLQYYRLSLTPSLLDKIHLNIKAGYDRFALFEIGKAHVLGETDQAEPDVPKEANALSMVYASKQAAEGAPYYQAKQYLTVLLEACQVNEKVAFEPLAGADLYDNPWLEQMTAPFEPARAAVLRDKQGLVWGVVGEFKASVRKSLKLPDYAAGFEVDPLLFLASQATRYVPLPRFPKVSQDITLKVAGGLPYGELYGFISTKLAEVKPDHSNAQFTLLDIYQRPDDESHKQLTFRLNIASYEMTLTDKEVSKLLEQVAQAASEKFNAEQI